MSGTHTHLHSAFGADGADNEGHHSHEHGHAGDSNHDPARAVGHDHS